MKKIPKTFYEAIKTEFMVLCLDKKHSSDLNIMN